MKPSSENLIQELIGSNYLKTPQIIEAFSHIKREDFVLPEEKDWAYVNDALSIGYNQTISQPLVVALMLELLNPRPGEKILDIGSGSGWTTALLAYLVKPKGKVIAIDIIKELVAFGERNVGKYNYIKKGIVKFFCADGKLGYEKEAPYDKILISASTFEIPETLFKQLKVDGKMALPIGESIVLITKTSPTDYLKQEFPGFVFVPLV
ncbi:MAG: protein-L-isoaspartate O-methyltransferase [Parcubacteria group bacterium]|nr:protein-L-isoaspartate O-methyltransferase [Parcubacteria group bacterium]